MSIQTRTRRYFFGAALGVLLLGVAWFSLSRLVYVPQAPMEVSRHFITLVQSGDLAGAYRLTNHGHAVGATSAAFEANIRRQMDVANLPDTRPVRMEGIRSGTQTYGNRFRRWVLGRKLDPDEVDVDYAVGGLPFDIRLMASGDEWRVAFFQSHAA